MKKKDLPYLPFYIGDWKKDPAVQTLTLEQKMVWLELIFLMWESEERGYLTINKKPIPEETLAFMLNLDKQKLEIWLTSFESLNLFSRRESDNAIYSRKILNIISLSETRSKAGSLGGNPNLVKPKVKQVAYPNAETDIENEIETDIDIETKNIKNDLFEKFWLLYPSRNGKKLGRSDAKKKFLQIKIEDLNALMIATENYTKSKMATDGYAKDAKRFLLNDYWKDWIDGSGSNRQELKPQKLSPAARQTAINLGVNPDEL